ncbi:DUF5316 family protein [Metabacillus mangrovi]|uniref:DUF5316 family protein n=1 Tax=Metabacillus mangrovi TaxID=1491830 RepID=UPI001390ACBF
MVTLLVTIGMIFILISGIFIGAWTEGQQQRANFHSETENHRNFCSRIALISGLALAGQLMCCRIGLLFIGVKNRRRNRPGVDSGSFLFRLQTAIKQIGCLNPAPFRLCITYADLQS